MAEIDIAVDSPSIRKKNKPKPHATVALEARRTLDNNIMIMDHEEIDIIIYTEKNKILALAKDELDDKVYETQDRFFKFLAKKGVVDVASVHSGNVYGSLEASVLESKINGVDSTQMVLLTVENFLDMERPYYMVGKAYRKAEQDRLLDPEPEDTTELGEVPHEDTQGSISTAQGYGLTGDSRRRGRNQHI
jgi:hypothetical protein